MCIRNDKNVLPESEEAINHYPASPRKYVRRYSAAMKGLMKAGTLVGVSKMILGGALSRKRALQASDPVSTKAPAPYEI